MDLYSATVTEIGDFWWKNITGARQLVCAIESEFQDGKSVVLYVPDDLPWRKNMRSLVCLSNRDIYFEYIDVAEKYQESRYSSIGYFLLETYGYDNIATGYRETSKYSIQQYLINNNVLRNKIVWVKGIPNSAVEDWIKFIREYESKSIDDGLFVIEVHGYKQEIEKKNIAVVAFSDYVSDFDVQLFCNFMLANSKNYSNIWKRYVSTVLASLCCFDAEIAAALLENFNFKNCDFVDAVKGLAEFDDFIMRGSAAGSEHVLGLCRNGRIDEIEHRIWKAQIQALFPLIELERKEIVAREAEKIRKILNEQEISQYGKELTDYSDVELGTLHYICQNYNNDISSVTCKRINFLHSCRNDLAHMRCCTINTVEELLNK